MGREDVARGTATPVERLQWLVDNAEYHAPKGRPATFLADAAEVREVLAALAAAEAERDQARSALEEHRIAYTALTGERDAVQAHYTSLRRKYDALEQRHWETEQRAARLAVLEQAARAWAVAYRAEQQIKAAGEGRHRFESDEAAQRIEALADLVGADAALLDAVIALATPSGDSA